MWADQGRGAPSRSHHSDFPPPSTHAPRPGAVGHAGSPQPKCLAQGNRRTQAEGGAWGMQLSPIRLCSLGPRMGRVKLGASLTTP